ncbi:hypothetical protein EYS14_19490 [Alteromonadaceae bacterium M269]|nr:hypothetical protein EYS14_19490 [Alteromonadaceae bacterium M269]
MYLEEKKQRTPDEMTRSIKSMPPHLQKGITRNRNESKSKVINKTNELQLMKKTMDFANKLLKPQKKQSFFNYKPQGHLHTVNVTALGKTRKEGELVPKKYPKLLSEQERLKGDFTLDQIPDENVFNFNGKPLTDEEKGMLVGLNMAQNEYFRSQLSNVGISEDDKKRIQEAIIYNEQTNQDLITSSDNIKQSDIEIGRNVSGIMYVTHGEPSLHNSWSPGHVSLLIPATGQYLSLRPEGKWIRGTGTWDYEVPNITQNGAETMKVSVADGTHATSKYSTPLYDKGKAIKRDTDVILLSSKEFPVEELAKRVNELACSDSGIFSLRGKDKNHCVLAVADALGEPGNTKFGDMGNLQPEHLKSIVLDDRKGKLHRSGGDKEDKTQSNN